MVANEHYVEMCYSDDGGHNWSNWRIGDLGDVGAFRTRVIFRRLGTTRARVVRIRVSGPIKAALMGAEAMLRESEV